MSPPWASSPPRLFLLLLALLVTSTLTGSVAADSSSSSSSTGTAVNASTSSLLLWSFSYSMTGSLYTVSTCGYLLTTQLTTSCFAGSCYVLTNLRGLRNATVLPSVASAGMQVEHVTNVGTPDTVAYAAANQYIYSFNPHVDANGITVDFDVPFSWAGHTANTTNVYFLQPQYVEYGSGLGSWQTVTSSSFTLSLVSNVSASFSLPYYTLACPAPVVPAIAPSSSSTGAGGLSPVTSPYIKLPLPFEGPYGVAVDAAGANLYVAGRNNLVHYTTQSNGSFTLNRSLSTAVGYPYGLALSSATSSLFVADDGNNSVSRFDANTGALLSSVSLSQADSVALDSTGSLFVSNSNNVITKYTVNSTGQLVVSSTHSVSANALFGLTVDGNDNVWVCDQGYNRVLKLSNDLTTVLANITVPSSPLNYPSGVAVHPVTGDVYIADQNNHRVVHLLPNLTYAGSFAPSTTTLFYPIDLAIDLSGRLYVEDYLSAAVYIYPSTLTAVPSYSSTAASPSSSSTGAAGPASPSYTTLPLPYVYIESVAVDAAGTNLYIGSYGGLAHYSAQSNGSFTFNRSLSSFGPIVDPYGLALSTATSSLFVVDYALSLVSRIDANSGALLANLTLSQPIGVVLDSTGSLFVSEYSNVVNKYNTLTGQLVMNSTTGFSAYLWGMAVDGNNNVYVCDRYNGRILKLSNNLTTVLATITVPTAPLIEPRGVAVHPVTGDVYIADYGGHRVVHLLPNLTYAGSFVPPTPNAFTPSSVALDLSGRLYVADMANPALYIYAPTLGVSTASAGTVSSSSSTGMAVNATTSIPSSPSSSTGVAANSSSPVVQPLLLWSFSYSITGNLYTVSTCGYLLTTAQTVCSGRACYTMTGLRGLRNATVLPSVLSAGMQVEHVTNVGVIDPIAYASADQFIYATSPYVDTAGITVDFDVPFSWNGYTANTTNVWASGSVYEEYSSVVGGNWQTVTSSSFTLTLLSSAVPTNYSLPYYTAACPAPPVPASALPSLSAGGAPGANMSSTAGATGGAANATAPASSFTSATGVAAPASSPYMVVPLPLGSIGVAVDAAGSTFYVAGAYQTLLRYTVQPNGAWSLNRTLTNAALQLPYGLALSTATSSLFVADYAGGFVGRLDTNSGALLARFTLNQSLGAALDASGNLFVSQDVAHGVLKYNTATPTQLTILAVRNLPASGVNGVAVDGSGLVYVCDSLNHRVVKLSNDLNTILANITVPASPLSIPQGVAVHPVTGDIYIADSYNYRVVHLYPNLTYAGSITFPPTLGMFTPSGVALDLAGRLYVTNYGNVNASLLIFNSTLTGLVAPASSSSSSSSSTAGGAPSLNVSSTAASTTGGTANPTAAAPSASASTGAGGLSPPYTTLPLPFSSPSGVAVDAAGANLYVAGQYHLVHYTTQSNGSFTLNRSLSTTVIYPYGLALSSATSSLFVADYGANTVFRLDANSGAVLSSVGLYQAIGVALDSTGSLFVSDWTTDSIVKYNLNTTGQLAVSTTHSVSANGLFGLTVDGNDSVWVCDAFTNRVIKLSNDFTTVLATITVPQSPLDYPTGVAVHPVTGDVYIADYNGHRVVHLYPNLSFAGSFAPSTTTLFTPISVALDLSGRLYVSDTQSAAVYIYPSTLTTLPSTNLNTSNWQATTSIIDPVLGPRSICDIGVLTFNGSAGLTVGGRTAYALLSMTGTRTVTDAFGVQSMFGIVGLPLSASPFLYYATYPLLDPSGVPLVISTGAIPQLLTVISSTYTTNTYALEGYTPATFVAAPVGGLSYSCGAIAPPSPLWPTPRLVLASINSTTASLILDLSQFYGGVLSLCSSLYLNFSPALPGIGRVCRPLLQQYDSSAAITPTILAANASMWPNVSLAAVNSSQFVVFLSLSLPSSSLYHSFRLVMQVITNGTAVTSPAAVLLNLTAPAVPVQVPYVVVPLPFTQGALGVAVDAAGANIYVSAYGNVTHLATAGVGSFTIVNRSLSASVQYPSGLALSSATSSLFLADGNLSRVSRLDATTGALLANASLTDPIGAALDASGNLFVSAGQYPAVMVKYSTAGGQLSVITSRSLPTVQLFGVAVDGNGLVYVCDVNGVIKLSNDLTTILANITVPASPLNYPTGVAVHPVTGDVYVADSGNNRVVHLFPNLTYAAIITLPSGVTAFSPSAIALDLAGRVYVTDYYTARLIIFNSTLTGSVASAPSSSSSSSSTTSPLPIPSSTSTSSPLPVPSSTGVAVNTTTSSLLLWAFNYSITGNLYTVSTCGYLLTTAQTVCSGRACYTMTGLRGLRNATVLPSVLSAGMQVEHVTNVGVIDPIAYASADQFIYATSPYVDTAGITVDFDVPFSWNGYTANTTNVWASGSVYEEYSSVVGGNWQTVISSSFTLTLLSSAVPTNYSLPYYTAACPAPPVPASALPSPTRSSSSSSSTGASSTSSSLPTSSATSSLPGSFPTSPPNVSSPSTAATASVPTGRGAACPSSTPTPSNPLGCVLYNFTTAVVAPNSVSVDYVAQPNTLIVSSISTSTMFVHYLNGSFYKQLSGFGAYPISNPETSTVDSSGFLFSVQDAGVSYVLIFTPYPAYSYLSVITGLSGAINDGLAIVMQGEYLFVTQNSIVNAYRIACNATGITSTTLVGQSPSQSDYAYGAQVNPVTGEIGVLNPSARTLTLLTPTYSGSSVTFTTSTVYNSSNSAMSLMVNARSLAITTGGLYVVMSETQPTLQFIVMYPNGTAASGATPLSGTPYNSGYFLFLAATPTGSMIFLPNIVSNLVSVYQGIDSGMAPALAASNNSCAVAVNATAPRPFSSSSSSTGGSSSSAAFFTPSTAAVATGPAALRSSSSSSSSSSPSSTSPPYVLLNLPFNVFAVAVDPAGTNLYLTSPSVYAHLTLASNGSFIINRTVATSLTYPDGMALGSNSSVYIADYSTGTVNRLDANTGASLSKVSLPNALGAALDSNGNLFISTYTGDTIAKYSTAGGQLTLNTSHAIVSANGLFGIAVDASNNVYVSDSNNNRVLKLSNDLTTVLANITVPSSPLADPIGVVVHPVTGDVYIADNNNHRVVHLFPNLAYAGSIALPGALSGYNPVNLALDLIGHLYVALSTGNQLLIFDLSGGAVQPVIPPSSSSTAGAVTAPIPSFATSSTAATAPVQAAQFLVVPLPFSPFAIAVDPAGAQLYLTNSSSVFAYTIPSGGVPAYNRTLASALQYSSGLALNSATSSLFVTEYYGNAVSRFDVNSGALTSRVAMPAALGTALDSLGNLFVSGYSTGLISKYSTAGGQLNFTSAHSLGAGYLYGVAADANNSVYVCEYSNNRVVKLSNDLSTILANITVPESPLNEPISLVVHPVTGDVYIADHAYLRVVHLFPNLSYAGVLTLPAALGTFSPLYMALDLAGRLYVTDGLTPRLVIFSSTLTVPSAPAASSSTGGVGSAVVSATSSSPPSYMLPSTGPASAYSDPRLVGFWGQSFFVSGAVGGVYCLLSDAQVQVNAYVVQLQHVHCPEVDGRVMERCWDERGTYFGVLSVRVQGGVYVRITAGPHDVGFHSVSIGDQHELQVGDAYSDAEHGGQVQLFINRTTSHQLLITAGLYSLTIDSVDLYADITEMDVQCWACLTEEMKPDGLLGRTWNATVHGQDSEQRLEEYRERKDNLLGCEHEHDRFCQRTITTPTEEA